MSSDRQQPSFTSLQVHGRDATSTDIETSNIYASKDKLTQDSRQIDGGTQDVNDVLAQTTHSTITSKQEANNSPVSGVPALSSS